MALLFRYSSMNVEGTLTFIFSDRYGIQSSLFLNFCKCILQNVLLFVFSLHHAYIINNILKLNHASIKHAIIKYLFTKQKKFLDIRPQIKYFQLCHLVTIAHWLSIPTSPVYVCCAESKFSFFFPFCFSYQGSHKCLLLISKIVRYYYNVNSSMTSSCNSLIGFYFEVYIHMASITIANICK